jgi:hypothetical protein
MGLLFRRFSPEAIELASDPRLTQGNLICFLMCSSAPAIAPISRSRLTNRECTLLEAGSECAREQLATCAGRRLSAVQPPPTFLQMLNAVGGKPCGFARELIRRAVEKAITHKPPVPFSGPHLLRSGGWAR